MKLGDKQALRLRRLLRWKTVYSWSHNGGFRISLPLFGWTLSVAPPTTLTRVLLVWSMASSAKRRAVGLGENPDESDNSSDENPEEDEDSGEEDSEASEEEINEVKEPTFLKMLMLCMALLAR